MLIAAMVRAARASGRSAREPRIGRPARRTRRNRDYFSKGIIIYAALLFLSCKTLFQLSYADELSRFRHWGYALIIFHVCIA
jgi:hypothetical protein